METRIFSVACGIILLTVVISCSSAKPGNLGLVDHHLAECPDRPNCVSSENSESAAFVEPLKFTGDPDTAWKNIKEAVQDVGGKIQEEKDGYLWATFTSLVFRFVDDLELRMDRVNYVIHVRSASRVGHSDLGVNRRRVERLRASFLSMNHDGN